MTTTRREDALSAEQRPGRDVGTRLRRDLRLVLGAGALVGLGALGGLLLGGPDGALTGTIVGFGACVLVFTLSTLLWTVGAGRRFREVARRR